MIQGAETLHLAKRYDIDAHSSKQVSKSVRLHRAKKTNFKERILPQYSHLNFGEFLNPIKKGSAVSCISHIFYDVMNFYHKLQSFSLSIGVKIKEEHQLDDGVIVYHIQFDAIKVKGVSTNVKKVIWNNRRRERRLAIVY